MGVIVFIRLLRWGSPDKTTRSTCSLVQSCGDVDVMLLVLEAGGGTVGEDVSPEYLALKA